MATYMAVDGVANDFHLVHLASRAMGGAAMVGTEMTCVSPDARITPACPGMWNDAQRAAWQRIVDFVHSHADAKIASFDQKPANGGIPEIASQPTAKVIAVSGMYLARPPIAFMS